VRGYHGWYTWWGAINGNMVYLTCAFAGRWWRVLHSCRRRNYHAIFYPAVVICEGGKAHPFLPVQLRHPDLILSSLIVWAPVKRRSDLQKYQLKNPLHFVTQVFSAAAVFLTMEGPPAWSRDIGGMATHLASSLSPDNRVAISTSSAPKQAAFHLAHTFIVVTSGEEEGRGIFVTWEMQLLQITCHDGWFKQQNVHVLADSNAH